MTWVLFDYGGVISSPQLPQDLIALARVLGSDVPALQEAYWACRHEYDAAAVAAESYWHEVADRLGRPWDPCLTPELVRIDAASWSHLRPATVRLVEELAARGRPLALLSNAPAEISVSVAALPVARHFAHLLFSCDLGVAKPDARCFREALARLGAEPAGVILVDDRPDNVEAAARLGLTTIGFTDADQARVELSRLGCL